MLRNREAIAIGLIALVGALAGCDAYPLQNLGASAEEAFMAVDASGVGGADGLCAKADAVTSESATISLPEDLLGDLPNEAFLAVDASEIAVVVNGDANGRAKPAAKTQEHHATIMFRLAHESQEACDALDQVGPFELTITDGVVTLAEESLPLDAGARSVVRNGRFEMCAETWADFDGSIAVGQTSFEFGGLRGNEERVVICHIPPGNPDDAHTISVGSSAMEVHLSHGDYLGECENPLDDNGDDEAGEDSNSDDDDGDPDEDEEGGADDEEDRDDDNENDADDQDSDDEDADYSDDDEDGVDDEDNADSDDGQGASDGDVDEDDSNDLDDDDEDGDADDDGDAGGGDGANGTPDDGDGVSDDADACLDTTSGLSVDSQGCAANQLDDDNDGVTNDADTCPSTPPGDAVYDNGCTVVTLSAFAGPDVDAIPGDIVEAVGQGAVLTGDYPEEDLVYDWQQVGGDPVQFSFTSLPLTVDTADATGDVTFMLTVSTADGSASASDELTINMDMDAITVSDASCDPETGHCYILATTSSGAADRLWWDDAKAKANSMYYDGMRGHLATITSAAERHFLAGVARNTPAMLGGTDREVEDVWRWADGPEDGQLIEYLPWAANEPSSSDWAGPVGAEGDEDYLQHEARGYNDINGARWYYVEFEPGW